MPFFIGRGNAAGKINSLQEARLASQHEGGDWGLPSAKSLMERLGIAGQSGRGRQQAADAFQMAMLGSNAKRVGVFEQRIGNAEQKVHARGMPLFGRQAKRGRMVDACMGGLRGQQLDTIEVAAPRGPAKSAEIISARL